MCSMRNIIAKGTFWKFGPIRIPTEDKKHDDHNIEDASESRTLVDWTLKNVVQPGVLAKKEFGCREKSIFGNLVLSGFPKKMQTR